MVVKVAVRPNGYNEVKGYKPVAGGGRGPRADIR